VPLSAGDRIPCVHCGHEVTPSAAHLALRDALNQDSEARGRAETLARTISAAGPILQALGRFVRDGGYYLLGIMAAGVGAFISMMAVFSLQSFGLRALHVDVIDVLRDGEYMALFVSIIAVFVGVIPIVAAFGLRTAAGRVKLLRSLAAKPPSHKGENPQCRQCGAPLVAAASDSIVARCHYCSADNLVVVSEDVLAAKISVTANVKASIQEAALEHRHESALVRRSLVKRLVLVALPVVLTYAAFSLQTKTGRPDWRDAVSSQRLWSHDPTTRISPKDTAVTYRCSLRDKLSVLMALRYGESLRAVVSSPIKPLSVLIETTADDKRPLIDDRGEPLDVQVPHSGWYEIVVQPRSCPLDHFSEQVTVRFDVR
jgi:hypothetical protein